MRKAIVMAGGQGTRLWPLTAARPKPLVQIANVPVMAYILKWLYRHGFTDVLATLHYRADDIRRQFGDGRSFGLDLTYRVEQEPLGTAGAIRLAGDWVGDEPLLIVSGDALTDVDLGTLLQRHQVSGALVTLGLQQVMDPTQYGVVEVDAQGMVTRFHEKPEPEHAFSTLANTGIFCVEPEVLDWIPTDQPCDWSHSVFPRLLAEREPLSGHLLEGYWCDVGSMAEYRRAQWDALTGAVRLDLPDLAGDGGIQSGQRVWIERGAVVEGPVILGMGCHIEHDALVLPGSILGEGTVVRTGACIWNAVLGAGCCVEANAIVRDCVIDDQVWVGAAAAVTGGTVVGRGSLIAAGTLLRSAERVAPEELVSAPDAVAAGLRTETLHTISDVQRVDARRVSPIVDEGPLAEEEWAIPA